MILSIAAYAEGGNVSEIEVLAKRVSGLSSDVDFWNVVMLWGLALAALAALVIGWSTRRVVVTSGQLSFAQDELSAAKEGKLQHDLKIKDLEIGGLKIRSDTAEASIATAQQGVAEANQQAAEANKAAEDERTARVKLEAQIAPRRLTAEQQVAIAFSLQGFHDRPVTVKSYALDVEGAVLSKQIVATLQSAHLKAVDMSSSMQTMGGFALGVHVYGSNQTLSRSLRESLSLIGRLFVVEDTEEPDLGPGLSQSPQPGSLPPEVTILVGVKPITP